MVEGAETMKVLTTAALKERYKDLPPLWIPPEGDVPYRWIERRAAMRNHVDHDDLDDFMNWSTVRATMVVNKSPQIYKELEVVNDGFKDSMTRMNALVPSSLGSPIKLPGLRVAGPSVHQGYHIVQHETGHIRDGYTPDVTELNRIVEFGGGFGMMAAIIHRMGFKGEYVIYDVPEFSYLQEFYLSNQGIEVIYKIVDDKNRFPVPPDDTDLVWGFNSLDEVTPGLRRAFLSTAKPEQITMCVGVGANVKHTVAIEACLDMVKGVSGYEWSFLKSYSHRGQWYVFGKKQQ
jgi:hypothetical protein